MYLKYTSFWNNKFIIKIKDSICKVQWRVLLLLDCSDFPSLVKSDFSEKILKDGWTNIGNKVLWGLSLIFQHEDNYAGHVIKWLSNTEININLVYCNRLFYNTFNKSGHYSRIFNKRLVCSNRMIVIFFPFQFLYL